MLTPSLGSTRLPKLHLRLLLADEAAQCLWAWRVFARAQAQAQVED